MLLAMRRLGRDYYVWDRSGAIDFLKPGRGVVHADFRLDDASLEAMRAETAGGAKHLRWFETPIVDAAGDTVALVRKQLYVRRKPGR